MTLSLCLGPRYEAQFNNQWARSYQGKGSVRSYTSEQAIRSQSKKKAKDKPEPMKLRLLRVKQIRKMQRVGYYDLFAIEPNDARQERLAKEHAMLKRRRASKHQKDESIDVLYARAPRHSGHMGALSRTIR